MYIIYSVERVPKQSICNIVFYILNKYILANPFILAKLKYTTYERNIF